MSNQEENINLVNTVSEDIQTDIITDLKTGIYNLFVSLVNNLMVTYGPEYAIRSSIDFLEEIVVNFKSTLPENQEK